ncbi:TetR/AcrR family transcriptional regulator [Cellulomonas fimi]|uniref:TetR/AcrR family transcriptional regulator n=1 Tax=Cellulomonas fimi TaxID=1708 RepID=A0A7Y0LXG5_CELFI|nr:TetR/AcrR family transcriptional regulator [Cellulomonas fimi]NMR19609.1 TetR/AcrR family transcriptional regulator [Cellulomonas fimi]
MPSTVSVPSARAPGGPDAGAEHPVGLRERQKQARREALIDAAHQLVERHGLDGATVEAICVEAGVSTRTFFNYFESKDDAVLGIEPWSLDPAIAAEFVAGGPTGRIVADLEVVVGHLIAKPMLGRERLAAALRLARDEPRLVVRQMAWLEDYRREIDTLVRRRLGADAPPDRVELLGVLVLVVTRSAFVRWDTAGSAGDARDHVRGVVEDLRALLAEL